jgi:hypothetical protein
MKDLLKIIENFNPQENPNTGDIRMRCPFPERHETEESRNNPTSFSIVGKKFYKCFSCKAKGTLRSLLINRFNVPYEEALTLSVESQIPNDMPSYEEFPDEEVYVQPTLPPYEAKETDKGGLVYISHPPKRYLNRGYSAGTLKRFLVGSFEDFRGEVVQTTLLSKERTFVGILEQWTYNGKRLMNMKPRGFDKNNFIYNQHSMPTTYISEGQSDVWRLFELGVLNSVALLGSELTRGQYHIIVNNYKEGVVLAMDNDLAGMKATEFLYHTLSYEIPVSILMYPAEDPGSLDEDTFREAFITDYAYYTAYKAETEKGYKWIKSQSELRAKEFRSKI